MLLAVENDFVLEPGCGFWDGWESLDGFDAGNAGADEVV
jgi:hypothetical protein